MLNKKAQNLRAFIYKGSGAANSSTCSMKTCVKTNSALQTTRTQDTFVITQTFVEQDIS